MKNLRTVHKLLLREFPKHDNNFSKNCRYLSIKKALESKDVDTGIAFLVSIMPVFDKFMTKFQKEPVIHMSHPNCEKHLKTAVDRLIKSKVYTEKKGKALK